ncbi:MAG: DNA polymerase domain-containing protein, partial [Promethearchaeia archaeon]
IVGLTTRKAKEYLEITLSDGRKVQCTSNHIIPKIENLSKINEIKAGNLKVGDEILIFHKNPLNNNPPKKIFIPNYIPTNNLWVSLERKEYKKYSYRTNESKDNPIINLINSKFKYSKVSKIYKCLWDELETSEKKLIEKESINYDLHFSVKYGEESGKWIFCFLDLTIEFFGLLGWYIAEGSIDKNRISITQKKKLHPKRYNYIISLLKSLEYPFTYDNKKNIRINSKVLKQLFIRFCSKGAANKKIPLELLDYKRAKFLLKNYYLGDGNLKKGKWIRYSTKSKQLKNDLVYLIGALDGYCSVVNPKKPTDIYRIIQTEGRKYRRKAHGLVNFNGTTPVRIKDIKKIVKEIKVYDIETANGWFIATNGIVVHNSYGVFGSRNFPLFCLPVAESTTGIGQYSIKKTIEKAESMGVDVLYGDSVIGSRCVVIKENELIDVTPIEEVWHNCSASIQIINGKEIKEPISMYTLSKNGKWQKIKQIIRHKTNKDIYRVNQKNGETICTEDHSLITEDYQPIKLEEIENKKILFLNETPYEPSILNETIDLYPLVKHYHYYSQYKGKKKLNKWNADENYIWFGWTNRKDQKKIHRYCNLSDLCKILGIYIADGHSSIHKSKYGYKSGAGISSHDISFLNEIKKIIKHIDYNHTISIIRTSKGIRKIQGYEYEDKTHKIQMNSTTWMAFFRSLCGAGSKNKHLPSFIFNVKKKFQKFLYQYYLIGDGSVEQGKNAFTTKSLRLVSGLCYLLKSWKIDTSIYYYKKRDVYRIRERERAIDSMHPIKTKLSKLPTKERYVYDLSVENTEMFIDACGMILLHNTDSVFLANPSEEQLNKISEWSKKELDLDLEEEKTYQFLALSERKKNYIGIYKDSKYPDIKGLLAKKRNTPEFIKTIFAELIEILKQITNDDEFKEKRDQIVTIVRENLRKIGKEGAFDLSDYAINTAITKNLNKYKVTPQHIAAALELREITGKEYQKGEMISFVKTKTSNGAKATEIAKLQDIDVKKYRELLKSALEQVLDALGITWQEIKGIKKMDAFF